MSALRLWHESCFSPVVMTVTMPGRRTLKLIAVAYAVKTALVALAWLAIPDLPQRARDGAQRAWESVLSAWSRSQD